MSKKDEAMKLALDALEKLVRFESDSWELGSCRIAGQATRALREALAEPRQDQEPVAWMHWLHGPVRLFLNKAEAMMELDRLNREYPVDADGRKMRPLVFGDTSPPAQPLPFGVGGGLAAIKTLLSRDPCVHANTAIQMIDAILAEQPAQHEPVAYAGVKAWVGNKQVIQYLTQTELHYETQPWLLMLRTAEKCIAALKEKKDGN